MAIHCPLPRPAATWGFAVGLASALRSSAEDNKCSLGGEGGGDEEGEEPQLLVKRTERTGTCACEKHPGRPRQLSSTAELLPGPEPEGSKVFSVAPRTDTYSRGTTKAQQTEELPERLRHSEMAGGSRAKGCAFSPWKYSSSDLGLWTVICSFSKRAQSVILGSGKVGRGQKMSPALVDVRGPAIMRRREVLQRWGSRWLGASHETPPNAAPPTPARGLHSTP